MFISLDLYLPCDPVTHEQWTMVNSARRFRMFVHVCVCVGVCVCVCSLVASLGLQA